MPGLPRLHGEHEQHGATVEHEIVVAATFHCHQHSEVSLLDLARSWVAEIRQEAGSFAATEDPGCNAPSDSD